MNYRRDIDGLRALAILPVVLYHAGFSIFSGGFVGVDVFFVISGFLITSIIVNEIKANRFSLINFYERRIRRIFPALFTVFATCTVIAALIFLPQDFKDFSQSLAAATLFASNLLFFKETGYFAGAAELKPLLHTWSLAVEEQFYIGFPILLLLIHKFTKNRYALILWPLTLLSLAAGIYLAFNHQAAAFYLPIGRAWELFIGGLLALGLVPSVKSKSVNTTLFSVGVASILVSIFTFSENTVFPGYAALLPCLGAALIIYSGREAVSAVACVLENPLAVYIGKISYSLYLWHWPLFAFYKYYYMQPADIISAGALIAASFILAIISYHVIEQPFRRKAILRSTLSLYIVAALGMGGFIALGALGHITKGLPQRLPENVAEMSGKAYEDAVLALPDRHKCLGSVEKNKGMVEQVKAGELCSLGEASVSASYILWGDSHAEAIRKGFIDLSNQYGIKGVFAGYTGCPPAEGLKRYDVPANQCDQFSAATLGYILAEKIPHVVMYARWPLYIESTMYGNETGKPPFFARGTSTQNAELLEEKMRQTIEVLQTNGIKVSLIAGTPEIGDDVSNMMAKSALYKRGDDLNMLLAPTIAEYEARQKSSNAFLQMLSNEYDLKIYWPHQELCDEKYCPVLDREGRPLYRDDDHLSLYGAEKLEPSIQPLFMSLKPLR